MGRDGVAVADVERQGRGVVRLVEQALAQDGGDAGRAGDQVDRQAGHRVAQRLPGLGGQRAGPGAGTSGARLAGGGAALGAARVRLSCASAAVRARSIIWSMTSGSMVPVTTGTVCASQAAVSASVPVR